MRCYILVFLFSDALSRLQMSFPRRHTIGGTAVLSANRVYVLAYRAMMIKVAELKIVYRSRALALAGQVRKFVIQALSEEFEAELVRLFPSEFE